MECGRAPLVWMDLEMTGLDPDKDLIMEVAAIVTDADLNILDVFPGLAISLSEEELSRMDEWCVEHHGASGLTRRVQESKISLAEAEERLLAFMKKWVARRESPLCGNSVWQDRRFLCKYMPRAEDWLHYRLIDVSTIKELARRWNPASTFDKKNAHLAEDDIRESIAELKYYRDCGFLSVSAKK